MLVGRGPAETEGLRMLWPCTGYGDGLEAWREGRGGCVSDLALLAGDFSGVALVEMVTLRVGFRPRCSRSLAATHSGQSWSLHCTTTLLFFFVGVGAAVLEFRDWWVSLAPLSVARRLLGPVWAWELLLSAALVDFRLTLATESALVAVAWVRLEYPESDARSDPGGAGVICCDDRFAAELAIFLLSSTSSLAFSS
jgi:hypothetical protein